MIRAILTLIPFEWIGDQSHVKPDAESNSSTPLLRRLRQHTDIKDLDSVSPTTRGFLN